MNKHFIDSNICVYAFDKSDPVKQQKSIELIKINPEISTQVIIETYNACLRKLKLSRLVCRQNALLLCDICKVFTIDETATTSAVSFVEKYQFSFLDSCIVSAAFHSGCSVLNTEDMQHGLRIERSLEIRNPYL